MTDYTECEWKDVPKDLQPGDQLIINDCVATIIMINKDEPLDYFETDNGSYSIEHEFGKFLGYRRRNVDDELTEFNRNFIANQKPLDKDFAEILIDNAWELYESGE